MTHMNFQKIPRHTGGYSLYYDNEYVGTVSKLFRAGGLPVGWTVTPENSHRSKSKTSSVFLSRQDAAHALIMYSMTKNRVWLTSGAGGRILQAA